MLLMMSESPEEEQNNKSSVDQNLKNDIQMYKMTKFDVMRVNVTTRAFMNWPESTGTVQPSTLSGFHLANH